MNIRKINRFKIGDVILDKTFEYDRAENAVEVINDWVGTITAIEHRNNQDGRYCIYLTSENDEILDSNAITKKEWLDKYAELYDL